jgi:hypothetical protein
MFEILLKVALNTITLTLYLCLNFTVPTINGTILTINGTFKIIGFGRINTTRGSHEPESLSW